MQRIAYLSNDVKYEIVGYEKNISIIDKNKMNIKLTSDLLTVQRNVIDVNKSVDEI